MKGDTLLCRITSRNVAVETRLPQSAEHCRPGLSRSSARSWSRQLGAAARRLLLRFLFAFWGALRLCARRSQRCHRAVSASRSQRTRSCFEGSVLGCINEQHLSSTPRPEFIRKKRTWRNCSMIIYQILSSNTVFRSRLDEICLFVSSKV